MTEPAGEVPREYGPYEVESVLGRGAMGMVYLARDRRIGRKVALKTVHVEDRFDDETDANDFFKRLQREAELCGSLQHPNIVTLYEPGYDHGIIAWMATEYVDGESLRERMKKKKPLPVQEALRIACDILRGLTFAHAKGIVHRDIKPANILLTSQGDAKIADFGIARPVDSNLTAVGEMLGTPSYMSPEQVKCTAVTARSDLFSVGAVLYEMVTGVKVFAANDISGILRNVVELEPEPAHLVHPQVSPLLATIIGRLLSKNPEDRYQTAAEALQDLEAARTTAPQEAAPLEVGSGTIPHGTHAAPSPPIAESAPQTDPSVTEVVAEDVTPAFRSRATSVTSLDRRIPAVVFFGVIAALLVVVGASVAAILINSDPRPTAAFSAAELQSLREKREALAAARALYAAGEYNRALAAYETFVASYPESAVGRDERDETRLAVHAQAKAASARVDVPARRPAKKVVTAPKKEEPAEPPAKRPSWWRRTFTRQSKG